MVRRLLADKLLVLATVVFALQASACSASEVGFARAQASDPGGPALDVAIWYPTEAHGSPQRLELFMQDVAPDAPVAAGCHR